jgi:hypothetical protein
MPLLSKTHIPWEEYDYQVHQEVLSCSNSENKWMYCISLYTTMMNDE